MSTQKAYTLEEDQKFLEESIRLAKENINNGGGPFGAVIVKDHEVLATGCNRVTPNNDPTAHAEVMAIRAACQKVQNFKLDGCVLYASCEPCPMCLSAIYWAGIERVVFAADKHDAADAGFDDAFIYEELDKPMEERSIATINLRTQSAAFPFDIWKKKDDKTPY